ncbi:cytochrome P450 [Thozetella sp. PMI_491]|nr:cytochrome P450 [Thozetella sp. PMI_491]
MADASSILGIASTTWLLALLGSTATLYLLRRSLATDLDPAEPPLLAPKIPLIGHILGLMRYQNDYFGVLEEKPHPPAYTLPVLTDKIYIIATPELIQAVYRNTDLSFEEFFFGSMSMLAGISKECQAAFNKPELGQAYLHGFTTMLSRENLHTINVSALKVISKELARLPAAPLQIDSFALWLRDLITIATTTALFGSKNPLIGKPHLAAGVYECNSNVFNTSIPRFMIKKELDGRSAISREFTEYFARGYDSEPDVSPLVKFHGKLFREQGLTIEENAMMHFGTIYGALSNTFPTFFFTIMHLFCDLNLLKEVRAEAEKIVRRDGAQATVNINALLDDTPLLTSIYRESFRVHFGSSIVRKSAVDTTISDGQRSYLIKKGHTVMLRVPAMHHAPEFWGAATESFDNERFLKAEADRARRKAFTPFGGGKHLCPGRNFAMAEILGIAVSLALGFDITHPEGGAVKMPAVKPTQLTHIFGRPKPGEDLRAQISRRKGWEDVRWNFV